MISLEAGGGLERRNLSDSALKASAVLWFAVALAGQWLFAAYILAFYGGRALAGDWQAWSDRMIVGFVAGDTLGNAAVILHIALAFAVTAFGPLQFIPLIRERAIGFHRWNGRVYVAAAFVISLGALFMVWTRGALDGEIGGPNAIGVSINAVLIMTFAGLAALHAAAGRIAIHHRWALRLFLAMSGVWFMRVGYGIWSFIHQGGRPPGTTRQLDGWFDIALPYVVTLFPLFVLEIYFRVRDRGPAAAKVATAWFILLLTALMTAGIVTFGARLARHF